MSTHRRAVEVMGTIVSLAVRGPAAPEVLDRAWAEVVAGLRAADAVFSTYRPDSAINRWGRGELALEDAPPEVAEVLALAEDARLASGGAFDIAAVRSPYGGGPDPSGVVKGWAVARGAAVLEALPGVDYCLSAGGDLVARTRAPGAAPWRIGIEDPRDPARVLAVVPVGDGAVATSGSLHRGEHILDPRSGHPARALRQVTVVAPDVVSADIDATTAFVLGADAAAWLAARGRTALVVDAAGATCWVRPSSSSPSSWAPPSSPAARPAPCP